MRKLFKNHIYEITQIQFMVNQLVATGGPLNYNTTYGLKRVDDIIVTVQFEALDLCGNLNFLYRGKKKPTTNFPYSKSN